LSTAIDSENANPAKRVFVISPIGAEGSDTRELADLFLDDLVRVSLPAPTYNVMRADEDGSPYAITSAMMGRLLAANFCVADISGLNPNVMYELALAHAAGKRVIIMTSDTGPMPFDIKDMRTIKYSVRADKIKAAIGALRQMAEFEPGPDEALLITNPVHEAFQAWTDKQTAASVTGGADEAVVRVVERLERKLDALSTERSAGLQERQAFDVMSAEPGRSTVMQGNNMLHVLFEHLNTGDPSVEAMHQTAQGQALVNEAMKGAAGSLQRLDDWIRFTSRNYPDLDFHGSDRLRLKV
jgi:hypothetical protein